MQGFAIAALLGLAWLGPAPPASAQQASEEAAVPIAPT